MTTKHSATLHYKKIGHGPDVLLIHGWGSSGRMWRRLMYGLQHHATFWAVDLAGFGASPLPANVVPDVSYHMDTLHEFCQRHHLQPRVVMGHSMGGLLTLKLALSNPSLMERFVLVCPVVTGNFGLGVLSSLLTSDVGKLMMQRAEPLWMFAQRDPVAKLLQAPTYLKHPMARARLAHDFRRTTWEAGLGGLLSIATENLEPHLHEIRHRALVVVGDKDLTVSPREGRLAAALLPNARLVEFEDSHHQPLEEEPKRFLRVFSDFLHGDPVGRNLGTPPNSAALPATRTMVE